MARSVRAMPMPMPVPNAAGAPPKLPGSPAGSPMGPGASPMVAPGAGKGNQMAAGVIAKAVLPALHQVMSASPPNSREYQAVLKALNALVPVFGKPQDESMVPAAILQMANAAKSGAAPMGSPATGLNPAPAPGASPPGGVTPPPPGLAA